ncbi:MAG: hypothetical protein HRU18_28340, partial [Pseudoalteromonas sp.]|nr:hypothetical protein [Pseudoalteromonas sp.]
DVDDYGYAKLAFRVDEGVRVSFDITEGQKGPMAVDVKLVAGAEDMAGEEEMEME